MPVTIKDIARRAGVAHTTVSRALRGSAEVSVETGQRIQRLAAEMGYRPSAAARSLKTNRSQVLGAIVSSLDDPFFSDILQGIESVAQASGYSLFIAASQRDPGRERAIAQVMREHRVDGVIICSTPFSPEQSQQFSSYGIPLVVINNQAAEDYRFSIYHDDEDGSRQLTRHLIGLGHTRIAYLGNSQAGRTNLDRLNGFQNEMKMAGLSIPPEFLFGAPGGGPDEGRLGLAHVLQIPQPPTALVCYNDMIAIGVLKGLHEAGLRIPEDISVTGFDNIALSAYTCPPLTTFDQPKRFIGAEAARLILNLLNAPAEAEDPGPNVRILKGRLLVRQSTAPVKPN